VTQVTSKNFGTGVKSSFWE